MRGGPAVDRLRVPILLLILAGLGAGGCGKRSGSPVILDLVEAFPAAELSRDAVGIEAWGPGRGAVLVDGWGSRLEGAGEEGIHGLGRASSLRFAALSDGPKELALRGRIDGRFEGPPGGEPFVEVRLDGVPVGEMELGRRSSDRVFRLPRRLLRLGDNLLKLRYGLRADGGRRLVEVGASGAYEVAWTAIRLRGEAAQGGSGAGPRATDGALVLPHAWRVDYFVRRRPGLRLSIDGMRPIEGDEPRGAGLVVELRYDDAPLSRSIVVEPGDGPVDVPLETETGGGPYVGVSLFPRPGATPAAGLVVDRPRILGSGRPSDDGEPGPAAGERGGGAGGTEVGDGPNVIVYLIDTLRADRLGLYGNERSPSPELDAFAEDAVVFGPAVATSSWTRTSVASLFTGMWPRSHGVVDAGDVLPSAARTVAEVLRAAGFETAGFVTNSTVSVDFHFDQGFHRYRTLRERGTREVHQLSDAVNRRFEEWLAGRRVDRPFFAYLHVTDPHDPYTPRPPYRQRFAGDVLDPWIDRGSRATTALEERPELDRRRIERDMEALYDGEIAFNDARFGELVRLLRRRGLYDSSLIVVTADHGEEFLDHGAWAHAGSLYEEVLRVPLVIRFPAGRHGGRRIGGAVSLADVAPTILDAVGLPAPSTFQARSLMGTLSSLGRAAVDRPLPAHLGLNREGIDSVTIGTIKLIRQPAPAAGSARLLLFDLGADPQERHDLSRLRPVTRGFFLRRLAELEPVEAERLPDQRVVIDGEIRRRLRAFGYLR